MTRRGVSIRISGGLGNQMFQYASARALALQLEVPLTLDLSFYDRRRHRAYGLGALPLGPHEQVGGGGTGRLSRLQVGLGTMLRRLSGQAPPIYREPHFHVDPGFFDLRAPVHLVGHFQSARYFQSHAEAVRRELAPPAAADALSQRLAARMAQHECCALHVRRGDYLSNPKNRALFAVCDERYYARALERLPARCEVLVFSDDMDWARRHLPTIRPVEFVEDGQPRSGLADLWLMSLARHHIIANSSLSWWGAWLARASPGRGESPGLAMAPRDWFVDPSHDDRDLVPADWTRL